MPRLKIENFIFLDSVERAFLIGEIVEGRISTGMNVDIKGFSANIQSIESVDGELDGETVSKIALKIVVNRTVYETLRKKIQIGEEVDITA
jgi:hypothetical protein